MCLAYANPPFSLLAKVLIKIAYEGGRVVMCTPDWGCTGEHAYWCRMLDRMTVGRVQLLDSPIYVPEDSDTAMQAPEWASFLSIVDGSLNPVPLCDLDQVLLKAFSLVIRACCCWCGGGVSAARASGLPGGWPYLLQDVRVCLLEVVEGLEEASLDAGHVLLCEVGVVLGGGVWARPQQRHEAGCHHVWAEL